MLEKFEDEFNHLKSLIKDIDLINVEEIIPTILRSKISSSVDYDVKLQTKIQSKYNYI